MECEEESCFYINSVGYDVDMEPIRIEVEENVEPN